ncbi:MAG: OmpA family protein [Deltaproteobacteria bacterium]|nr:OmpA family protein [Deltaproteobacteria bacterium]
MRANRAVILTVLGVVLGAQTAFAQGAPVFNPNVDVQQWRPAPGPNNFLTVHGARVDGMPSFSVGGFINYAYRPFVIFNATCTPADSMTNCSATTVRSVPVEHLGTLNALASVTLFRRLQIALDLPISLQSGDNIDPATARRIDMIPSQTRFALGDPRLDFKVRLAGDGLQGVAIALNAFVQAPLGRVVAVDGFLGDSSLAAGGRAIVDFRRGRFSMAANVGAIFRAETAQLYSTFYGSRLLWGAAFGVEITPRVSAMLEGFGSHDLSGQGNTDISVWQQSHIELTAAGRYRIGHLNLTLGGGTSVLRGFGAPAARVMIGAIYAPSNTDTDRDGVTDENDRCPNEPEDMDGFEDSDGCPEADNDADGILDGVDRCPNEPEDRDGFQDQDGCPDRDNDNDGIPDGYDSCPNAPEDRDGDRDEDGCPDDDRDRDGIPDDRDRCPTEPEDTDGFEDTDGCPDPDNDQDGVLDTNDQCSEQPETVNGFQDDDGCPDTLPDRDGDGITDDRDQCPDQPENYNGIADTDGCPERGPSLVSLQGDQIRILSQVNFATNSDRIVGRRSFQVLDAVASILTAHPEFRRVEVQGHTDNRGDAEANRTLSRNRAAAVRQYLVTHNIAEDRVTSSGFGPDRPIESNANSRGRAANRRVEFRLVGPAAQPTGTGGTVTTPATPATPAAETPATPAAPAAPAAPATP